MGISMKSIRRSFYFWRFCWRVARSLPRVIRVAEAANWEVSGVQVLPSNTCNSAFFLTFHLQHMTAEDFAGVMRGDLSIQSQFEFIPSKR